ncbi:bifunctional riboflavin kinase/FAD synthetase [Paenibacillus aquistagni]|uniref:bifunctional riboflavin kinase/FAD synthetase n=1 Tax=Paenibacillus aquistagni TaxID=1852522 RepID=UPI00145A7FE9|nr:bifunctional riboflavin kinase/FAD synthetase [Paenibacillus aquistagni]NMM51196.1 bifunctional riboflavin kinase/FAD synthetase [Paenibacillus aquistagni]
MQTIHLLHSLEDATWEQSKIPQAIILGHFDGIHQGHQHVIKRAVAHAKEQGLIAGLMTFHPHPKGVFGKPGYDRYLTPLGEKERQLEALGVDRLYVVEFDTVFAQITPSEFVHALCRLDAKHVVCGFDYRFGHRGAGTAEMLREEGKNCFTVDIVEPIDQDGTKVSSTRIRECLDEGDVTLANELLGRSYMLRGEVVHGEKRGRAIGYPTANVQPEEPYYIPKLGVYAVRAEVRGETYDSVLSVGLKPTFHSHIPEPVVEAHLFDFHDDIYGKTMTVYLKKFIRGEQKFNSVQELINQIHLDAEQAKVYLRTLSK